MDRTEHLLSFWRAVVSQNADAIKPYFAPSAYVCWNNTNERFTVEEYIIANCEYPGVWQGEVARIELIANVAVTVARVWDHSTSFHVTSFFEFCGDKISALNEYWGDDGTAPQWRLDKQIGRPIK